MPREIKKPTILKDRLKEPPVGKEVCFMQICPKYERKPSPFASLTEDECLNCIHAERVTEEFAPLANKICRYPTGNEWVQKLRPNGQPRRKQCFPITRNKLY